MKFQLKSIGNPVEILMKYQWKSIENPVEISLKYRWNFFGRNLLSTFLSSLLNNLEHIFPIFPRSKSNIHLSDLCPATQPLTLRIFLHRRNYKTMPSKAFIVCSPSKIIIVVDHLSFQHYHCR